MRVRSSCFTFRGVIHRPFDGFWNCCARSITCGNTRITCSTSSIVDSRPNENRTSELATFLSTPNATITCDGSNEPAEQADPLEAQIPSRSSPANREMLSYPATVKATVFDKQLVFGLRIVTPLLCKQVNASRSLSVNGLSCA